MIYGDDGRQELHEVTDRPALATAASTVALFHRDTLHRAKDGLIHVGGKTYGEEQNLCAGERFAEQPAGAFCTGVVVGPDLVLTAGHCLEELRCEEVRVAFGYANLSLEHAARELLPEDVMECREILRPHGKSPLDFALIRLAGRSAQPAIPFASHEPFLREPVVLTGHPSGLPLKVVADAGLTRVKSNHLSAQLDAFGGNSGSPVTNRDTGELLGILVEGEEDFVDDPLSGCRRARTCTDGARCGSEKILRISAILRQLGGELPSLQ